MAKTKAMRHSASRANAIGGKPVKQGQAAQSAAPRVKARKAASEPARKPRPRSAAETHERRDSKRARIIAMLQTPAGATIEAMTRASGWQQHSVRGFLAGVVRKKLKLKLRSDKIDSQRTYRIENANSPRKSSRQADRPSA